MRRLIPISISGILYSYIAYVISSFLLSLFFGEDTILKVYKIALKAEDEDLEYRIWFDKSERVENIIKETQNPKNKNNIRFLNKKKKALQDLIKFMTKENQVKKEIKKYRMAIRFMYMLRRVLLSVKFFFFMAIQSLPMLILVLTSNLSYAIITSGLIMIVYAIYLDINTRKSIAYLYGKESANDYMSNISTRISVMINSLIEQLYFYVLILINFIM